MQISSMFDDATGVARRGSMALSLACALLSAQILRAETNAAAATAGDDPATAAAPARQPEKYPLLQPVPPPRPPEDPWAAWGRDEWDPFADDWDPFEEIRRMHKNMSRILTESARRFEAMPGFQKPAGPPNRFSPDVDLVEEDNHFVVRLDVPGIDKSKLNVDIEGRMLIVSGVTESETRETEGDRIMRMERRRGSFHRSTILPGPVTVEGAEAMYENGVLTVRIPKAKPGPGKIPVKIKSGTGTTEI